MSEADRSKADRKRLQGEYRALYDALLEVLFREDPGRVHSQEHSEKYVPEVVTVLPRLRDATSVGEVQQIVHEELRRWYGSRIPNTDCERLHQAADEIWFAWHRFLDHRNQQPQPSTAALNRRLARNSCQIQDPHDRRQPCSPKPYRTAFE
jgi:hypothetical protein